LSGKAHVELVRHYVRAGRRALLLDYDGTLVPFAENPKMARPDHELIELMATLGEDPANDVVIISGRSRSDLENWFGNLPVALVAEHGVWLRRKNGQWRMLTAVTTEWKDAVRPIFQIYVDRLPGALLEEKEYSLAWHYRRADPDQAAQRANELLDDLSSYTRNIDVQVFVGRKVIEIRNSGVTKGAAALNWMGTNPPEFILGIGDDSTDEDLFRGLPAEAYSVRVGFSNTAAKYYLSSPVLVRRLLRELAEISRKNHPLLEEAARS